MTRRLAEMGQTKYQGLINSGKKHFNGKVLTHPDTLDLPRRRRQPTVYFVNSMSDLFHREVPDSFIVDVFEVMASCPQHTFQVLTKRPERMQQIMPDVYAKVSEKLGRRNGYGKLPLANVWLGTSVENQEVAAERVPFLSGTLAATRFLSCEPLLEDLPNLDLKKIHWVIVGGESGPGAREMKPEWVVQIRNQCRDQRVAFFFKQWGGRNKKATGRELDGKTWDAYPKDKRELSEAWKIHALSKLDLLQAAIRERGDEEMHADFVDQQMEVARHGWIWRANYPELKQLFRAYAVS
jgi:protein gp37